jgi:tetratricopeptide (TPR) repeat protein
MRNPLWIVALGLLSLNVRGNLLWADTITFANGGTMEGTVIEETDQKVTIAIDGGTMTFQSSEVASIVRMSSVDVPETLETYGQKLKPMVEEFLSLNEGLVQAIDARDKVGDKLKGMVNGSATPKELGRAFDKYHAGFDALYAKCVTIQRKLGKLTPPAELSKHHGLLLKAVENRKEGFRLLAAYMRNSGDPSKSNDMLFQKASEYGQAAQELYKEAMAYLDSVLDYADVGHYQEEIRNKPDDADSYLNLALSYIEVGRNQEAIEALKEVIRLNPNNAKARYALGLAYLTLGEKDSALEQYRRLKELDPSVAEEFLSYIYKYGMGDSK